MRGAGEKGRDRGGNERSDRGKVKEVEMEWKKEKKFSAEHTKYVLSLLQVF